MLARRAALAAACFAASPGAWAAQVLSSGQTLAGERFEWQAAYDFRPDGTYGEYTINLQAGRSYEIFTSSAAGGDTRDTYLYVMKPSGLKAAEDDDSGGDYQAKVVYRPSTSGAYTVRLRAWTRGTGGSCSLTFREVDAVPPPTLAAPGERRPLLPDLMPWRKPGTYMYDAIIVQSGGRAFLRFSNAPTNIGDGPFEIWGEVAPDGRTIAHQRVYWSDGGYEDRLAGEFVFDGHEGHNHFHFADFAGYRLRAVAAGLGVGPVLRVSEKVSFALLDVAAYDRSLPGAPPHPVYDRPEGQDSHQGVSIGWADVYGRELADQGIDVTGIPDGQYWLESEIDPNNRLLEKAHSNNVGRLLVELGDGTVHVIGQPPSPPEQPTPQEPTPEPGVAVFPNPWRADRHNGRPITFPAQGVSEMSLYTVTGRQVRVLQPSGDFVRWDLSNATGERVPSGYYLYMLKYRDGRMAKGWLAVIR